MATVLTEAVRGSVAFGHAGDTIPTPFTLNAGSPRNFVISFPSSDWTNISLQGTLTMSASLERSLDGGSTWQPFGGFSGATNIVGKGGVIPTQQMGVSWDGRACLVRGGVTVGSSFSYGINVV